MYLYVNTQNALSSGYKQLIQILKGIAEEKIQNYSADPNPNPNPNWRKN